MWKVSGLSCWDLKTCKSEVGEAQMSFGNSLIGCYSDASTHPFLLGCHDQDVSSAVEFVTVKLSCILIFKDLKPGKMPHFLLVSET